MLGGFLPSSELPRLGRVIRAMRLVQPTHPEVGDGSCDVSIRLGPLPHVNQRNVVLGLDRNCNCLVLVVFRKVESELGVRLL